MRLLLLFLLPILLMAEGNYTEAEKWGAGIVIRHAAVPYKNEFSTAEIETSVNSAVPFLYYENKYFFIDGIEGGIKAYEKDSWRISLISRMRFVDIPKDLQNQHHLDTFDFGLQTRYLFNRENFLDTEFLSDPTGHYYANVSYKGQYDLGDLDLEPYATARIKSSKFNTSYYGLNQEDISAGVDFTIGVTARYHVISNLYLIAGGQGRRLDKAARESTVIGQDYEYSVFGGVGFFNDKDETTRPSLSITPYLRLAHGWATHYDIDQILTGSMKRDEYKHQLTSIFYGYPLADRLFTLPIQIYITPGFVWHHKSEVQDNLREYVLAVKAYYTIPLPIRVRLGLAEGISYINEVTWIESEDLKEDGNQEKSKVLNYLDFSIDINVGDLIFVDSLQKLWLGANVHHRSGIFTYSSQYGRVNGGSNYPSVYLQMDF